MNDTDKTTIALSAQEAAIQGGRPRRALHDAADPEYRAALSGGVER